MLMFQKNKQLTDTVSELKEENRRLEAEVLLISKRDNFLEKSAREVFGLVGDNELVYIFNDWTGGVLWHLVE